MPSVRGFGDDWRRWRSDIASGRFKRGKGTGMLRLVDQPRPLVWAAGSLVSPYYRAMWAMRDLPDWERVALRRATFVPGGNFLYIHAPKAGSSSVKALLRAAAGGAVTSGARHWAAARPMLRDAGVFRFSFVLHPVSRALATFDDLFVRGRHPYSRRHWPQNRRVALRYGDASPDNFSRYLDYVEDAMAESAAFCDPHLRQQVLNLYPGEIAYGRIGRVENFAADMAAIAKAIGLDLPEGVIGAEMARGVREAALSRASAAQIERIGRIYAPDFAAFGYGPEPG